MAMFETYLQRKGRDAPSSALDVYATLSDHMLAEDDKVLAHESVNGLQFNFFLFLDVCTTSTITSTSYQHHV